MKLRFSHTIKLTNKNQLLIVKEHPTMSVYVIQEGPNKGKWVSKSTMLKQGWVERGY